MDLRLIAPLCELCTAMLSSIGDRSKWILPDDADVSPTMEGPHHATIRSLLTSVAQGCAICARLQEYLDKTKFPAKYNQSADGKPWLDYLIEFEYNHLESDIPSFVLSFCDGATASKVADFTGQPLELEFEPDPESYHGLPDITSDEKVMRRAYSWLLDCLSDHGPCTKPAESDYFPPRILQLNKAHVRLVETNAAKVAGQYATLSYCWGRNPKHLTLTARNLDILRAGLQVSRLAKTFRDAVQVAQALGMQYLWIDALCILQSGEGHVEDWELHVVEMGKIYANCALNIAADHGEDAEAGLFTTRNPDQITPCIFEIPCDAGAGMGQGNTDGASTFHLRALSFWADLLEHTPLHRRGWVHQERLLSNRILHFGKQISWECSELLACESFPEGLQVSPEERGTSFNCDGTDPDTWVRITEDYSDTSLTKSEDKLSAIAGIAMRISGQRNAHYAAGTFTTDLPQSLLWSYYGGRPIVSPYRAPSWSWASREGRIFLYQRFIRDIEQNFARVQGLSIDYCDESNPFGPVKGASVTLAAPMARMAWADTNDDAHLVRRDFALYQLDPRIRQHDFSHFFGSFYFDESSLVRPRSNVEFVFVSYTSSCLLGLMIAPAGNVGQSSKWLRIGLFYLPVKDLVDQDRHMLEAVQYILELPKLTIELV